MSLLKKSLANAIKNIMRNKLVNFLCFGIIAFTLLIFGIFDFLSFRIKTFTDNFSKNIEAIFYFKDNVELPEIEALIKKVKENLMVKEVQFRSKNQAEISFRRQFPDFQHILSEYSESPFPSSIEVKFKNTADIETKMISIIEDIEKMGIIKDKQVNIDWAKKFTTVKNFISAAGLFLSMILIFVSIFIIFNVIKLNIFYRKDEIKILELVGAQDWYIRFPFIIEGILMGIGGSILAVVLLFIILKLFPAYASSFFNILLLQEVIDFKNIPMGIFFRLIVLGVSIGLFSSYVSIRRFLKN